MKKILSLIFIVTSAAAQSPPISCAGSNWTGTLWQQCVIDNSNPIVINICTINPGCTNQSQWQVVGGGGTGSVTTTGTPTVGTLPEFSGSTSITNSPLADNGSIVSSSENFNAPQISTNGPLDSWFTGTGSLIGFNEGTCTGTIPSLTDWLCDSNSGLEIGVAGGAFHAILYNGSALGTPASGNASNLTNFPTLNQNTTGNAATATNLASYPTLCTGTQFSQGLSSGSNNCGNPAGGNYNGYGMWNLTVPSNLTNWINQGTSVSVTGTHFVAIASPQGANAHSAHILNAACPSGFTSGTLDLYALVEVSGAMDNEGGGIEIDDGTKIVTAAIFHDNSSNLNVNTQTSFSATPSTVQSQNTSWPIQTPLWWHVHDAAGTLTFDYSFDGIGTPGTNGSWVRLVASTTGGLSAVTNCGIVIDPYQSGDSASIVVLSFAFLSSLTAQ